MSIPRRRSLFKRLLEDPLIYECVIATAALVAAIWEVISDTKKDTLEKKVIAVCAFMVFAFTILKQFVTWNKTSREESPHELQGCLQTLHSILLSGSNAELRITIHVPVPGDLLEQIMNYVGESAEKHTEGRRFPVTCGIAGQAFRCKNAVFADRTNQNHAAFIDELKKNWGFTEVAARACNPDAMSWCAIPLESGKDNTIEGVIYFDCNQRAFFTPSRQDIAIMAAAGIARFIKKRY
jgi:putative methionine-R-sulfoxide reductase with GAF domain